MNQKEVDNGEIKDGCCAVCGSKQPINGKSLHTGNCPYHDWETCLACDSLMEEHGQILPECQ